MAHTETEPLADDPLDEKSPYYAHTDRNYARITAKGIREMREEDRAAEERRKANAPPPDTRTPEQKAEHLRQFADGFFLQSSMRSHGGPIFDVQTFKAYLDDFTKRAGASGDPVEQMLLHQLAQAHFAIGRLHVRASGSHNTDEAAATEAAAARLMGEFRKTGLALQAYREAAARTQAAAAEPPAPRRRKKRPAAAAAPEAERKQRMAGRSEVGSNTNNRLHEYFNECEPALS